MPLKDFVQNYAVIFFKDLVPYTGLIIIGVVTELRNWVVLAVLGILFFISEFTIGILLREKSKKQDKIDILLKLVYKKIDAKPDEKIRCSFIVPLNDDYIKKVASYNWKNVYDHSPKKIRSSTGTVGKAFRTKKEVILPEIDGEFTDVMLNDWGFTRKEVDNLTKDRKSYLSFPFLDEKEEVLGIICVDSAREYFATKERRENIRWFVKEFCDILNNEVKNNE